MLYQTKGLRPTMRDKQKDSLVKVTQILVSIVAVVRQLTKPSGLNMFLKYFCVDHETLCCLSLFWMLRLVRNGRFHSMPIVIGGLRNMIINKYLCRSACRFTPSNKNTRFSDVKRALACILI